MNCRWCNRRKAGAANSDAGKGVRRWERPCWREFFQHSDCHQIEERIKEAAPEMLAALKELRSWYIETTGLRPTSADAAIAKAEGIM